MKIGQFVQFNSACYYFLGAIERIQFPKGTTGQVVDILTQGKRNSCLVWIPFALGAGMVAEIALSLLEPIEKPDKFEPPDPNSNVPAQATIGKLATMDCKRICLAKNEIFENKLTHCPDHGIPLMLLNEDPLKGMILKSGSGNEYQLENKIVSGKFCSVHMAKRLPDDGLYVIKLATEDGDKKAQSSALVLREESRLLSTLEHKAIAKIVEEGEHEGQPFFVMPYYRAPVLSSVMDTLALDEILWTMSWISDALIYLHSRDIVHPRLSSSEIIVAEDTSPAILLDFGESKLIGHPNGTYSVNGVLGGDVSEFAPELLTRKPISPATNVYAFAAILFRVFAKRPVFVGKQGSAEQALAVLYNDAPKLSAFADMSKLDPQLEALIQSALEKEPAKRPAMAEFRKVLNS